MKGNDNVIVNETYINIEYGTYIAHFFHKVYNYSAKKWVNMKYNPYFKYIYSVHAVHV